MIVGVVQVFALVSCLPHFHRFRYVCSTHQIIFHVIFFNFIFINQIRAWRDGRDVSADRCACSIIFSFKCVRSSLARCSFRLLLALKCYMVRVRGYAKPHLNNTKFTRIRTHSISNAIMRFWRVFGLN